MYKRVVPLSVTAVFMAACAYPVWAQEQPQGQLELAYMGTSTRLSGGLKSAPSAARLMWGQEVAPGLSIEAMLALGTGRTAIKQGGVTLPQVKAELNQAYGLYLKPRVALSEELDVFARLGVSRVRGTVSDASGQEVSEGRNSLSYGVGLSYRFSPEWSLNADAMSYTNRSGMKVRSMSLGLGAVF